MNHTITLTIADVAGAGSIEAAIIATCEESDELASGTVGPSFATSGPGPGWSRQFSAEDFAIAASEAGCCGYIDASDGRLATVSEPDDDGEVEVKWTDESVVILSSPTVSEVDDDPDAARQMLEAIDSEHCTPKGAGDWDDVRAWVNALS